MFFHLFAFLNFRSTLQHNSNDLLICGDDRIEEMKTDGEKVDVVINGCLENLTIVRVHPGVEKIEVMASNKAGKVGLYVWSPSGLYDSNHRWHCTDMIGRLSNDTNVTDGIPPAVKHHKVFNSTGNALTPTTFIITSQNQSAESLYCFLVLQKLKNQQHRRVKRDGLNSTLLNKREVQYYSLNEKRNQWNQNMKPKTQEDEPSIRPEPNMLKVWGFTTGFILEILLGSFVYWRYRKLWKRNNTVAILGQKMYTLLSEPGRGSEEKRRELKRLVKKFKNGSEDELLAESSEYSTSAATPSSVTTETMVSESGNTSLTSSSPSPPTSTVTDTEDIPNETGISPPPKNISPDALSSVKLRPMNTHVPDKQLPSKTNHDLKTAVEKDLLKRRRDLGYVDVDYDNDSPPSESNEKNTKHVTLPEGNHKSQGIDFVQDISEPSSTVSSPLGSISSEMLASVKLKPVKNEDKSNASSEKSIFERLMQIIPQRSETEESTEENEDWNNANLKRNYKTRKTFSGA